MVVLSSSTERAIPLLWIANFLLCVLINCNQVSTFNLDSSVPIIKRSRSQTYFGFSVAQHHINEENRNDHVIIVGAPRENVSTVAFTEPGAVYRCPLSTLSNDCTRVIIDETPTVATADKSNQWLGVSVASQRSVGGYALACAHRYKKSGAGYVYGLGICFSLSNDLEPGVEAYEPCEGKPVDKAHEQYAFCQTGTSADVHKNGTLLLGVPGPLTWRGALFKNGANYLDNDWYESVSEDRVPGDSYLGMAVRIGENIFADGGLAFIGGAPKSHGSGEVLFFRQGPSIGANSKLPFVYRLLGDQFYSGFGYDVIVGDFNGDGKNDLVVGAPFYHGRGISGAIYIYFNTKGGFTSTPIKITSRQVREAECEASRCYDARFGFALATIGDLDKDGCQDFVVGAPFEGNGAIYIFRGSKTSKIETYSQRIVAADIRGANLKTFGYSLSGGNDVDGNTYPDLTVGAYQSDSVVVLRARPLVNVLATLESNPRQIDPKLTNCSDGKAYNCLTIKVCLRFNAEPKDKYSGRLNIKYRLEAEKFTGTKVVRIFFGVDVETYFVEGTVSMRPQNEAAFECASHVAYLRRNNRDFLSPIVFRLTYDLSDSQPPTVNPGQSVPDFYSYPILNQTTSGKDLQVSFIKNCGQDDVCNSDLKLSATLQLPQQSGGDYQLKLGEVSEIRMTVSVTNGGEDAHETVLWADLPDNMNLIGVESKDGELSCTPVDNNKKLECDIGNPVASKQTVSIVIRLNPNRLSRSQNHISIGVSVNTTSTEKDVTDDKITLQVAVVVIIDLAVIGSSDPSTAYYEKGVQQTDYKPAKEAEIGPEIVHKFEVKNAGKVIVEQSDLTITWPAQVIGSGNQKLHLLYIMEPPHVKGNSRQQEGARCTVDDKFVNPEKVEAKFSNPDSIRGGGGNSDVQPPPTRKKRSTPNNAAGIEDKVCGKSSSIICASINCKVFELGPGQSVVISIRSRLWNRTISSIFPDAYELSIQSTASIGIDQTQSNTTNDIGQAVTKLISSTIKPQGVALWIIILAVCAGILLLVALVILLWKCGFFKRKKADQFEHTAIVKKSVDEEEEDGRDGAHNS